MYGSQYFLPGYYTHLGVEMEGYSWKSQILGESVTVKAGRGGELKREKNLLNQELNFGYNCPRTFKNLPS